VRCVICSNSKSRRDNSTLKTLEMASLAMLLQNQRICEQIFNICQQILFFIDPIDCLSSPSPWKHTNNHHRKEHHEHEYEKEETHRTTRILDVLIMLTEFTVARVHLRLRLIHRDDIIRHNVLIFLQYVADTLCLMF